MKTLKLEEFCVVNFMRISHLTLVLKKTLSNSWIFICLSDGNLCGWWKSLIRLFFFFGHLLTIWSNILSGNMHGNWTGKLFSIETLNPRPQLKPFYYVKNDWLCVSIMFVFVFVKTYLQCPKIFPDVFLSIRMHSFLTKFDHSPQS